VLVQRRDEIDRWVARGRHIRGSGTTMASSRLEVQYGNVCTTSRGRRVAISARVQHPAGDPVNRV